MSIINNPFDDEYYVGQMAFEEIKQENQFLRKIIEDLTKDMIHEPMPEIIISEPIPQIVSSEEFNLEQTIINCLSNSAKGLTVWEILKIISVIKKDIDKSSINSCLYKMLNKKILTKSSDKRSIWNIK